MQLLWLPVRWSNRTVWSLCLGLLIRWNVRPQVPRRAMPQSAARKLSLQLCTGEDDLVVLAIALALGLHKVMLVAQLAARNLKQLCICRKKMNIKVKTRLLLMMMLISQGVPVGAEA